MAGKSKPIRWVCARCLAIVYFQINMIGSIKHVYNDTVVTRRKRIIWPLHCGVEMLLAGPRKKDVHGLRKKGLWIDPVDNLRMPKWEGKK